MSNRNIDNGSNDDLPRPKMPNELVSPTNSKDIKKSSTQPFEQGNEESDDHIARILKKREEYQQQKQSTQVAQSKVNDSNLKKIDGSTSNINELHIDDINIVTGVQNKTESDEKKNKLDSSSISNSMSSSEKVDNKILKGGETKSNRNSREDETELGTNFDEQLGQIDEGNPIGEIRIQNYNSGRELQSGFHSRKQTASI